MPVAFPFTISRALRRCILVGTLVELVLLAHHAWLPNGSWISSAIEFVIVAVQRPFFWLLEPSQYDLRGLFCALLFLPLTGCFWGFFLYSLLSLMQPQVTHEPRPARRTTAAKYYIGLSAGIILLSASLGWPQSPRPFATSAEIRSVVAADNAFAVDLYQKLKGRPGNVIFSPYSISDELAMTWVGSRGQTEAEMSKVLHFDSIRTNVGPGFLGLTKRLNDIERWNIVTFQTANSLWHQQNYEFTHAFLNLIQMDFAGSTHSVDFTGNPESARKQINSWVERQTDGRIEHLVGAEELSSRTRLALCNAIYFKGKWQTQFDPSETQPRPFYVSSNETVTVPMMYVESHFKRTRVDDNLVKILELPYAGDDLSMVIVLPVTQREIYDTGTPLSLSDVERQMTANNLQSWLEKLDRANGEKTIVCLPRFTTVGQFNLSDVLKSSGMVSAFNEASANFSGMDRTTSLYLSDVVHKAFIEVDESGTEAAATTWGLIVVRSMPEQIIADHPFIFLIRDNATGAILFLGRIVDPTK